ncbi:MAG TPA: DUF2147 domain-containing protein [Sphingomonas sp.]|nr:DUF2147 domain-containing protein [Sphingomonas sp.]
MARTLLLLALLASAGARQGQSIFGRWRTGDGKAIVSIERCGPRACGTVATVLDPAAPKLDTHNPDRALRQRRLVGLRILSDFMPEGDDWRHGRAYDPSSGRSYAARLSLGDDGRLAVTGCVLFLCRTQYWTRVTAADAS